MISEKSILLLILSYLNTIENSLIISVIRSQYSNVRKVLLSIPNILFLFYSYSIRFMQEEQAVSAKKQYERIQEEQRKFRNLESDQKYYTDEVMIFIRKQKGTVEKLQNENASLKDTITKLYERKGECKPQDAEGPGKVEELKEQIREEREKQAQTRSHIGNFQKKIVEKKNHFGGYNSGSEAEVNLQKQIRILENRLDKANQKYNESIAFNKELKASIEGLRKERKIFDALYDKLEKELQNKRKCMANIIEKTNNAYEERDRANFTAEALRQDSKKETVDFEKELKELSHIQLKSKLSAMLAPSLATTSIYTRKQEVDRLAQLHEEPGNKLLSKSLKDMKSKLYVAQSEKLQKYKEDFAKIEAATGVNDFSDLIRIFASNEEKNFKVFRFINEQSNEIEELTKGIEGLREEIEDYEHVVRNPQEEKKGHINRLREQLSRERRSMEECEESNKKLSRSLSSIVAEVEGLFAALECDAEVAKELSGTKIVSDSNMVIFLAIIEEKILKLISLYKSKTKEAIYEGFDDDVQVIALGGGKRAGAKKSPEHLLLMESDEEDENEINSLMTYNDFMKKANDKIAVGSAMQEQQQRRRMKLSKSARKKNELR